MIMIRLEMKNYNIILTEKHQKYPHYYLKKLTNMNMKQVKNHYLMLERAKFTYSP